MATGKTCCDNFMWHYLSISTYYVINAPKKLSTVYRTQAYQTLTLLEKHPTHRCCHCNSYWSLSAPGLQVPLISHTSITLMESVWLCLLKRWRVCFHSFVPLLFLFLLAWLLFVLVLFLCSRLSHKLLEGHVVTFFIRISCSL